MANLDDFDAKATNKRDPLLDLLVEIDMSCENCGMPAKEIYLSKNRHTLTSICNNGHKISIEGNYLWLIRLLGGNV